VRRERVDQRVSSPCLTDRAADLRTSAAQQTQDQQQQRLFDELTSFVMQNGIVFCC